MKKHIIIAGVPRAGKSTVSQMIAKQFGYQHGFCYCRAENGQLLNMVIRITS